VNHRRHPETVPLDRRLIFLMTRAQRALLTYASAVTREAIGVSSTQLGTIYYVAKHPGASASDVADMLDLNKSAMSSMLRRLETAGLVRRDANPTDGRGSRLFLTAKGETVRSQALVLTRRLTSELTDGFSAAEVETIVRFLNSVVERFGDRDQREQGS
jgi:DNA-binding MarR family transcriptional regulator